MFSGGGAIWGVSEDGDIELADCTHSGLLLSHSFISPFLVFGNLKLGSSGSTAAATNKHAEESGVSGDELAEFELQSTSGIGD